MHVFITGISSGLGLGLTRACLERGDQVYGLSRRPPPDDVKAHSGLKFLKLDLEKLEDITSGLKTLLGDSVPIDLVILNAGILGEIQDLKDSPLPGLKRIMNINLWSNKIICDFLIERQGAVKQVVSVSSGASRSGHRGWSGYAISKVSLNMLTQLYAAENPDTHYTALAPGLIDTAMQDYIYTTPPIDKFPALNRLREARGTDAMPDPAEAAKNLLACFPRLLKLENGSFADIRKL